MYTIRIYKDSCLLRLPQHLGPALAECWPKCRWRLPRRGHKAPPASDPSERLHGCLESLSDGFPRCKTLRFVVSPFHSSCYIWNHVSSWCKAKLQVQKRLLLKGMHQNQKCSSCKENLVDLILNLPCLSPKKSTNQISNVFGISQPVASFTEQRQALPMWLKERYLPFFPYVNVLDRSLVNPKCFHGSWRFSRLWVVGCC